MKNYNEKSEEEYFIELDVQYLERLYEIHSDLLFLLKKRNLKNTETLLLIYMIKMNMLFT